MTYYRYTHTNNPMSDWGHAMFTEHRDMVEGSYGEYGWLFDGDAVNINDLRDAIIETWNYDCEHGFIGDFGSICEEGYWAKVDAEEIADGFNPDNIVDSAENWDSELVMWIWERVLEPSGFMAVATWDGAIVFDAGLIERA